MAKGFVSGDAQPHNEGDDDADGQSSSHFARIKAGRDDAEHTDDSCAKKGAGDSGEEKYARKDDEDGTREALRVVEADPVENESRREANEGGVDERRKEFCEYLRLSVLDDENENRD